MENLSTWQKTKVLTKNLGYTLTEAGRFLDACEKAGVTVDFTGEFCEVCQQVGCTPNDHKLPAGMLAGCGL